MRRQLVERSKGSSACRLPNEALTRELRENLVRFFERLFAPDIKPGALDLIGLHRLAGVEPLDESSGLIRIISRGDVGGETARGSPARNSRAQSRSGCSSASAGFSSNCVMTPSASICDAAVFLDRFEIADVVGRQRRFGALAPAAAKSASGSLKQIVARDDDQIAHSPDSSRVKDQIEYRRSRRVCPSRSRDPSFDDFEGELRLRFAIAVRPGLKIFRELVVRDHVNGFDIGDRREIIEHPFDHRFARHFEERFRFVRVSG